MSKPFSPSQYKIISSEPGHLQLHLSGDWVIGNTLPSFNEIKERLLEQGEIKRLSFCDAGLENWDSRLVSMILKLDENFTTLNKPITTDLSGLPQGLQGLLSLAKAVPERAGARKTEEHTSSLERLGNRALDTTEEITKSLTFLGEISLSLLRFFRGKARYRKQDFWQVIQTTGPGALPIVTLISLLIGLILAYIGAIQLSMFGADIYVANLVAIGMTREMGAMMTAIIMSGRTGAAFAAQLGTMEVNEEIDAFKTLGIATMDFLVLPRMLALILMMPLLTLYANLVGMLGGLLVAMGMMNISLLEYYHQTQQSITLVDCGTGLVKSIAFGIIIAATGCQNGIQCGRSASAVGDAATKAVVQSIVAIIVTDAVFTILFERLGI